MKDIVAIVGSHPRTRTEFDFTRTDCDIWTFNEAVGNPNETWCPRSDAIFQMHDPIIWRNPRNRNHAGHHDWLMTQTDTIVYMQDVYPDVPMSRRYPLEDVLGSLHFNKRYFTSSVAYAIALAAHYNYKKLELYGVEMETDTEYRYQRDGVTFWLGVAVGRGIQVEAHCELFEAPLYGYEGDVKLPYDLFTKAVEDIRSRMDEPERLYNEKRRETAEKIKTFMESGKSDGIVQAVQEQLKYGIQFGTMDGARQENERYKKKADAMIEKTGDFIFSRQEFETVKQALQMKQAELMSQTNVMAGNVDALFAQCEKAKNRKHRKERVEDFIKALDPYIRQTIITSMVVGALDVNQHYLKVLDGLIRAAGGSKSEAVMLEAAHADRV